MSAARKARPAPSSRSTTAWPSTRRATRALPIFSPPAASTSFAHDHRGHGFTKAPDAPQGIFGTPDGGAKVLADVAAVHALIAKEHPGLPVIVFGHSMGGLIAMNFLFRHSANIQAAAIWNANFSAGFLGRVAQGILAWEKMRLGSDVPSRILPKLTFQAWGKKIPNHRTQFDWLSHDTGEVDKYVADPLCGWDASVSMWRDVFGFVFAGADDRNFSTIRKDLPFNLAGGEEDPATDGGKAVKDLVRRMTRMGFSNLVSKVYPEDPARKPERGESKHDHGRFRGLGRKSPSRD